MWLDAGVAVEMALHVAVNEEALTAHLARVPHVTSVLPRRWDQGFGSGLIIASYGVMIHFFPKNIFRVLLCLGSGIRVLKTGSGSSEIWNQSKTPDPTGFGSENLDIIMIILWIRF